MLLHRLLVEPSPDRAFAIFLLNLFISRVHVKVEKFPPFKEIDKTMFTCAMSSHIGSLSNDLFSLCLALKHVWDINWLPLSVYFLVGIGNLRYWR